MGKKLTQEEFDVRIQKMTGNSYVFLEPFVGTSVMLGIHLNNDIV